MPWLTDWGKRIKMTTDGSKTDANITNMPLMIHLASGTGQTNANTSVVFDELNVMSSGVIDSYTKLLLHMDGDQSSSQHDATSNGNPTLSVTESKFGGSSMDFDGSGDYVSVPDSSDWNFYDGDFTIDLWVNFSSLTGGSYTPLLVSKYQAGTPAIRAWYFRYVAYLGYLEFGYSTDGSNGFTATANWSPGTDIWYHVTVVRDSIDLMFFVDGTQIGSTYNIGSHSIHDPSKELQIGMMFYNGTPNSDYSFNGYMNEVRLSKGIARWTSNFTPPSSPYTTTSGIDSYTKLLLHFNGDALGDHSAIFNGNPQLHASNGKFNGSYNFDGSGDYLSVPSHADWNFDSDFTIDFWVYLNAVNCTIIKSVSNEDWNSASTNDWNLRIDGSSYIDFDVKGVGTAGTSPGPDVPLSTWTHVAVVRYNNIIRCYKDGSRVGTKLNTSNTLGNTQALQVGRNQTNLTLSLNGYLDEVRISKGIARWTQDFIPPTRPYPQEPDIYDSYSKKIAVADNDGNQQYVEIEYWNPYLREAALWTKTPTLTSGTNKTLYLYYDSTHANNTTYVGDTTEAVTHNVWSSNYSAVWHMSEEDLTTLMYDSTSNLHHLSSGGSMTGTDLVDGNIGKCVDLDGSDDYFSEPDSADFDFGTGDFTLELSVNSPWSDNDIYQGGFSATSSYTGESQVYWNLLTYGNHVSGKGTAQMFNTINGTSIISSGYILNANEWLNMVVTRSGSNIVFYVNNVVVDTATYGSAVDCHPDGMVLGRFYNGLDDFYYKGKYDEVRIVKGKSKTAAEVKADYYNKFDDFITFGAEESPSFYVDGYVKEYNLPVSRTVRIYRRDTGVLMGEDVSLSSTGYYYVTTSHGGEHFVVAFDDDAGDVFNALINDRITPEAIV